MVHVPMVLCAKVYAGAALAGATVVVIGAGVAVPSAELWLANNVVPSVSELRSDGLQRTVCTGRMRADPLLVDPIIAVSSSTSACKLIK